MPKYLNVRMLSDSHAEIKIYGEIVPAHPTDWWTGEKIDGQYSTPTDFAEELEKAKNAAEITILINSPGGAAHLGQAMYTQLKALPGHKTAIVEGLAASAATLPLMAADVIKLPVGARVMIHQAAAGIFGWYEAGELEKVVNMLDNASMAAAETYHSKTGIPIDEIIKMMKAETWLTGREAVEIGFADELLFENEPDIAMSSDGKNIVVNGSKFSASMFSNIPTDIPVKQGFLNSFFRNAPKQAAANNSMNKTISNPQTQQPPQHNTGGKVKMIVTTEQLRTEYPELCSQLEAQAKEKGITQERERLQAIEEIAQTIADAKMLTDAKFGDSVLTAGELALAALKQEKKLNNDFLYKMSADNKNSGAQFVGGAPNHGNMMNDDEKMLADAQAIASYANKK